jgi:putative membrane protein
VHDHGGGAADFALAIPLLVALALYLGGVATEHRRNRPWPWSRTVAWIAGLCAVASGFLPPLSGLAHSSFQGHMALHLLVGMVAPVLVVVSAPFTLALRSLDVVPARRLSRLLNSRLARFFTAPVIAGAIDIGGMWVLYGTPLFERMQSNALLHVLVMGHLFVAGLLFTAAIIPIDPSPHRASYPVRAAVLVAALAAHGILAKTLYAQPPAGIEAADAQAGAMFMYYAGDAVDAAIIAILCAQWYRHAGRRLPAVSRRPRGSARFIGDDRRE